MSFDYSKLKGRIIERYGSQAKFAKAMGWSERTMSKKINGDISWKQSDICTAMALLGLAESDVQLYFFKVKVQDV